jgi:hypothetical protein
LLPIKTVAQYTADTTAGGFSAFTASSSGTPYLLWEDRDGDAEFDAAEPYAILNFNLASAAANTVTIGNTSTTIAARSNTEVSISLTGTFSELTNSNSAWPVARIAAAITSQPSTTSLVYPTLTSLSSLTGYTYANTGGTPGSTAISTSTNQIGSSSTVASIDYSGLPGEDITATTSQGNLATLSFTPNSTGVYTVTVWNESSVSGSAALSGTESYKVFSVIVSSGVSNLTVSTVGGGTFAKAGANGALIKVCTTDSAGNIAIPATGETVTLTPSGDGLIAKVNGVATSASAGAYNLSAGSFGASTGCAYINVTNGTAETISIVASMAGVAAKTVSLTSRTLTAATTTPYPYSASATGYKNTGTTLTELPIGSNSTTFRVAVTAATYSATTAKYIGMAVVDTTGYVTGLTGTSLGFDAAATLGSTDIASFSVASSSTATAQVLYYVTCMAADGLECATSPRDVKSLTTAAGSALTVTPSSISAIPGATVSISVAAVDNFGRAYANQTISATSTGRNVRSIAVNAITNADGVATFTFADTNSTSALVSDTISFTGAGTGSASVTYSTSNSASTITLTSTGDTDVVAGTTVTDIDASYTGATGTYASASALVKNSAGSVVAGAPVTFTVTGLTGAEVHTTKATVYTDATGTAVAYISSYATGKATVTATSGTATATDDVYFAQTTDTEARTITATVSGNVVTATVKDRYGNPVRSAYVWATRTGDLYFGSGASTSNGTTDKDGKVDFIIGGGTGTVKVQLGSSTAASDTFGQSANAAGQVGNSTAALSVDAYVAGTTTTDQEGLGGSLSPVGVNSATASVTVANATAAAAEAASDAAAEAIDAANAATDAANLAAEAADAATVAAEEARDAADAATAAVEELATQVATLMAALKAQITTLANTVAKIAKKVKA